MNGICVSMILWCVPGNAEGDTGVGVACWLVVRVTPDVKTLFCNVPSKWAKKRRLVRLVLQDMSRWCESFGQRQDRSCVPGCLGCFTCYPIGPIGNMNVTSNIVTVLPIRTFSIVGRLSNYMLCYWIGMRHLNQRAQFVWLVRRALLYSWGILRRLSRNFLIGASPATRPMPCMYYSGYHDRGYDHFSYLGMLRKRHVGLICFDDRTEQTRCSGSFRCKNGRTRRWNRSRGFFGRNGLQSGLRAHHCYEVEWSGFLGPCSSMYQLPYQLETYKVWDFLEGPTRPQCKCSLHGDASFHGRLLLAGAVRFVVDLLCSMDKTLVNILRSDVP